MEKIRSLTRVDINTVAIGYGYFITASGDKKVNLKNSIGGNVSVEFDKL